jgi:hypothetical protein
MRKKESKKMNFFSHSSFSWFYYSESKTFSQKKTHIKGSQAKKRAIKKVEKKLKDKEKSKHFI